MSAVFSPCRTWRYTLTRENLIGLDRLRPEPFADVPLRTVAFIGLNPSTADETTDDPTVRRCMGFARRWGYDRMVMLNAFSYRATDPKALGQLTYKQAVGPQNDSTLLAEGSAADLVVCAWGVHGARFERGSFVGRLLRASDVRLYTLGLTKDGHPKHPLYLRGDLEPVPWG